MKPRPEPNPRRALVRANPEHRYRLTAGIAPQIGAAIQRARTRKALKQTDLASAIACVQPAVSQWETGVRVPSALQVRQIALALDVSADELLGLLPPRRNTARAPKGGPDAPSRA